MNYGDNLIIPSPNVSHSGGSFYNNDGININNEGIININNIEIGKYNIDIYYVLNLNLNIHIHILTLFKNY
jgi:hypothetical protein